MKKSYLLGSFLLFFIADFSQAASHCLSQARDAYEKLYCRIVEAEGSAHKLPGMDEFRRNNKQIQRLLLKRPAKRLGLKLPSQSPAVRTVPVRKKYRPPVKHAEKIPVQKPLGSIQKNVIHLLAAPVNLFDGCVLQAEKIQCNDRHYLLAGNVNNQHLNQRVFSQDNQLQLEKFRGKGNDKKALHQYLSDSYRIYIEKMLVIGLGGATMPYSKFYYIYEEIKKKKENFSARFHTMYEFLKKDKASMAVKSRYTHQLPENLSQCMLLSSVLIVCDKGSINWVYARNQS